MAYGMTNYGIPQLRQRNIMSGYGYEPEMGYDPGMDDYGDPTFDPGGYNVGEILSPYMNKPAPQAPPIASTPSSGRAGVGPDPGLSDSIRRTMDAIGQVYTPEYTDRDRLRALMDAAPEREAPGFGRALVAAGLSLKAADPIAASEAVMTAPHRRNMADWLAKSEPFLKTAELENRSNINERTLAGNVVTAQTQADRIASNEKIAERKAEIAEIRARAYDYSQRLGKGWDWDLTGPTAKKINKTTGEIVDTGLETGKMDEKTKIELQNEGRVNAARETGLYAGSRAAMTGPIYQTNDGKQYRVGPDGTLIPAEGAPGPLTRVGAPGRANETTPAEAKQAYQEKLRPIFQLNSDHFINRNGVLEEKPRPKPGWFGNDSAMKEWDRVHKMVDPSYVPPTDQTSTPRFPEFRIPTQSTAPTTQGVGPSSQAMPMRQQKAADFLKSKGYPVSQANIEALLKTGRF